MSFFISLEWISCFWCFCCTVLLLWCYGKSKAVPYKQELGKMSKKPCLVYPVPFKFQMCTPNLQCKGDGERNQVQESKTGKLQMYYLLRNSVWKKVFIFLRIFGKCRCSWPTRISKQMYFHSKCNFSSLIALERAFERHFSCSRIIECLSSVQRWNSSQLPKRKREG